MALPLIISPSMQPTDHISTALVYCVEPNKISGALYHRVATYSVRMAFSSTGLKRLLARPKSATLTLHSASKSTLDGFKSLCMISAE
jgi:hypothetical protein